VLSAPPWRAGLCVVCAVGGAGMAQADVFKCAGPDGKLTYQDAPCVPGSNGTTLSTPGAAATSPAPAAAGAVPPPRGTRPVDADAGAYRALAAGNQADRERWQGHGGDPARYAKNHPEAIYDAMGSERDLAVLEFVLKSGANPNARGIAYVKAPIFVNPLDRDKVALLIRYGANLNESDTSGYTPLLHALAAPAREFRMPPNARAGQKVRVATKLDLVRLLLDSGARCNGDLGAATHAGALELARREDRDVIELLVARGATLEDPEQDPRAWQPRRGPLTIAIQQERDDLALALLGRDPRLAANDNLALLEAARRGFSELALALVNAHADPNRADAQGATALGWAERRNDAPLTAALQRAGAKPSAPPRPKLFVNGDYGAQWASQIDAVALFDAHRFYLDWRPPKPGAVAFLFYAAAPGALQAVNCEDAAVYHLVAPANRHGSIQVGRCTREAGRVRDAARSAQGALAQMTTTLGAAAPQPAVRPAALGQWDSATYAGGWEGYRYPLLGAGRGVATVQTVVLANPTQGRAVIVQADLGQLCEPTGGIRTQLKTPLCEDTAKALTAIALAVARTP
jgi:ankyrin repeat protein